MKKATIVIAAALCCFVLVSSAGAEVFGRRHIGIGIGTTWVGDATIDQTSLDFSAGIRLPIDGNFDLVAFHRQAMLEGQERDSPGGADVKMKNSEYGVGLACHFLPKRPADPFLRAGLSNAMTDTIVDGRPTYADEHLMFQIGGGAEINVRENISLILGAAYHDDLEGADAGYLSAGMSLNGWLSDLILVGVGVSGVSDTGDLSAEVTAAYAF